MSIVAGKGTTALSEWMRGFRSSGQIWDGKQLHIAVADELDSMAAEIERLRDHVIEVESRSKNPSVPYLLERAKGLVQENGKMREALLRLRRMGHGWKFSCWRGWRHSGMD